MSSIFFTILVPIENRNNNELLFSGITDEVAERVVFIHFGIHSCFHLYLYHDSVDSEVNHGPIIQITVCPHQRQTTPVPVISSRINQDTSATLISPSWNTVTDAGNVLVLYLLDVE